MQTITTIGLDIAKSIFQVHGVDAAGNVIVRRKMSVATFWRFPKAAALPGWYRSMRLLASLVA
jgi:hypothetical protein